MVLDSCWHYEMAQRQEKFMEGKFTYAVIGWNPKVDLFVDGPTRFVTVGDSKTQLPNRNITSLAITEARGTQGDGELVQVFDKI